MVGLVALVVRALLMAVVLAAAAGCGASHRADSDGDDDDDADADGDTDADVDPRPECPEGDDLVIGDICNDQSDCDAPLCGHQGGVCIEETWTCGRCDYCFFERTPRADDPGLECNRATGVCE
jgi:hypothetical protein